MAKRKRYGCASPELTLMELSLETGRAAGTTKAAGTTGTTGATGTTGTTGTTEVVIPTPARTAKTRFVRFIGMWLVGPVMVIIRTVYPAPSKHTKHKAKHEHFPHNTQSPVCGLFKQLRFTDTTEKDVPKQQASITIHMTLYVNDSKQKKYFGKVFSEVPSLKKD